MKNSLGDLNNYLFLALERLNNEKLTNKELALEKERISAISLISKNIIENAKVTLAGEMFRINSNPQNEPMPDQFKLK